LKAFDENRFNIVLSSRQSGKALALDTPIPTPDGWKTMGELKEGDKIYGQDGESYSVTMIHPIQYDKKCYEVEFDNGEKIIADADHNWFTQHKSERKNKKIKGSVKTTTDIFNTLLSKSGEPNHRIPSCIKGVYKSEKELLIPPYVLGMWLGDGAVDGPRITVGTRDIEETLKNLSEYPQYTPTVQYYKNRNIYNINLGMLSGKHGQKKETSLSKELIALNLTGNKHIPEIYMQSSRTQRLELLKGLIDSDGYVDKRGYTYFYNCNIELVEQVKELVESLGYKTTYKKFIPTLNGKECSECAEVAFHPREEVCKLTFKKSRIKISNASYPESNKRNQWHYIKNIKEVESVPVRCITVDSPDSLYLCGKSFIPTHNTTVLTILALWFTCFHDYKNTVIVANKEDTAKMIFKRVKLAYQELPIWLKPAVVTWGQESSEFANGSVIGISTTTGSAARGQAIQLLLLDELAFIEPESIVEDFMKSVIPTISRAKTSRILITSTPKGKNNIFYKYYDGATKEGTDDWNGFHAEEVMWTEIPGRDEEWKRKEIAKLGSYEAFKQEYECFFLDDGTAAIDVELFDELKKACVDPKHILDDGHYKIWEDPDQSRVYVAGVDVSEGVGGDASVIQVLDITDLRDIRQVAEYHNNLIAPAEFSNKLYEILLNWGSPLVLIERNNQGGQVCDRLAMDFGYEKVVSWGAKKANRVNIMFGIISHTNTKHSAVLNQRYFINEIRNVTFRSINTLNEFKTFVRYPNGTWKAKGGEHDDRVMAFIWALMILFNEITELYFEIDKVDDYGKPLVISPYDYGIKYFENPTSIYTNEVVDKIENSNLSPMAFGSFGEMENEITGLISEGWQPLNGGMPYFDPSRNISDDHYEIIDKWFT
jgi:hypothetical protein